MLIDRRHLLIGTAGGLAGLTIIPAFGQVPPLKKKDAYKVGFAQTESNNPWRLAQTASMKAEAAKRGAQLVYTDAAGSAAKQVADVNSMIAQGVDFIFLPPREEKPLIPAVMNAKKAGIPVLLIDRNVDPSLAKPGVDFLAFIGSNFVQEGQRVADWTIKRPAARARSSNSRARSALRRPTTARRASTTRSRPRRPTWRSWPVSPATSLATRDAKSPRRCLQAHPDATIVYAHNDEMALGAIAAIEAAGKVPGKDILVVSIDGEKDGIQAIVDGKLGCSCECNPRFGPAAFDIMTNYANGDKIPPMIINPDNFYDASNAKEALPKAY